MRYRVTEGFATPQRRFVAGIEIDAAEIDGPVSPEGWVRLGRLSPVSPPGRKSRAPAPEERAEEPAEESVAELDRELPKLTADQ